MIQNTNTEKWQRYVDGALWALRAAMGKHYRSEPRNGNYSERAMTALRGTLPYVLHRVPDETKLIWLNRDYKPLSTGAHTSMKRWVDYQGFPELFVAQDHPLVMDMVKLLPHRMVEPNIRIYLFDDGNAPWNGAQHARRLEEILRIFELKEEY